MTSTFTFRLRMFWQSLAPSRRAAIRQRRRFYSMPHLRRTDEPSDDFLP